MLGTRAFAGGIDNDIGVGSSNKSGGTTINNASDFLNKGEVSQDDKAVVDLIKNQDIMSSENLETAQNLLSPVTNVIGILTGIIVAFASAAIFLITALDLLYISVPPVRPYLYASNTDGTGGMTGGRMGMMGGMQSMPGNGAAGPKRHQWVSDEAVQCAAMLGGSAATAGAGMRGMGGAGWGMGGPGMGGMGMGGMGMGGNMGMGGSPESATRGSVIKVYFKKRLVFMILFAICIVVLTSSVLIGTGANLALWVLKILDAINKLIAM